MYFVYLIFRKICTAISSELLLEYFVYTIIIIIIIIMMFVKG